MGEFIYGGSLRVTIDDRALAHLQLVISNKLRRGESFHFSWREDASVGGRTSVWVTARSSLIYKYDTSRPPLLNAAWLDALSYTANSETGLHLVPEPAEHVGDDIPRALN
jgi:hypothetical protein